MSTRQASRPCMIPLVQLAPGSISRGAIQHLIPADSRWAQIASAVGRSLLEWLMKTIEGMLDSANSDRSPFGPSLARKKSPDRERLEGNRRLKSRGTAYLAYLNPPQQNCRRLACSQPGVGTGPFGTDVELRT